MNTRIISLMFIVLGKITNQMRDEQTASYNVILVVVCGFFLCFYHAPDWSEHNKNSRRVLAVHGFCSFTVSADTLQLPGVQQHFP